MAIRCSGNVYIKPLPRNGSTSYNIIYISAVRLLASSAIQFSTLSSVFISLSGVPYDQYHTQLCAVEYHHRSLGL
jgi:hypothetical protein